MTIGQEHLRRSLAYESYDPEAKVLPAIQAAAAAFLAEARRRWNDGGTLDLDLADAFKGFVLAAALEEDRDRDRVFLLFGKETLVKSRNHHKVLRREIERVEALCQVLSGTLESNVSRLLDAEDGPGESSER